jgi:hypothetical protein
MWRQRVLDYINRSGINMKKVKTFLSLPDKYMTLYLSYYLKVNHFV